MHDIFIYAIVGLFLFFVLWIFNSFFISPLIIYHYMRNKKEPNKIVVWFLEKTNPKELLTVYLHIAWIILPFLNLKKTKPKKHV